MMFMCGMTAMAGGKWTRRTNGGVAQRMTRSYTLLITVG